MVPAEFKLSFIIPAKNEAHIIADTIASIYAFVPKKCFFEIVVIDNGSKDCTQKIARDAGASVFINNKATIAKLRNIGVSQTTGKILIFLDADVHLTIGWTNEIESVLQKLNNEFLMVAGSRCGVADSGNYIQKYWFHRMINDKSNYVNSGHLITTRKLFNMIGGFNERLKTAEDYDFCLRARSYGASIRNYPELSVIHFGYPCTFVAFIRREMWHGTEDFKNVNSYLSSKQAILASAHVALVCFLLILSCLNSGWEEAIVYITIMFFLTLTLSIIKFGLSRPFDLFVSSFVMYLYIIGRSLSLLQTIWLRIWLKSNV